MAKSITGRPYGGDAHRFTRPDKIAVPSGPPCHWDGCHSPRFAGLPVCPVHAIRIHGFMRDLLEYGTFPAPKRDPEPPKAQAYVYYLMIGPSTVKIGTTRGLPQRLNALRTEAQYVVAIERGGRDLERRRHKEFADERIGRREDFRLSNRLKSHIEALQPDRDELVAYALSYPKVTA